MKKSDLPKFLIFAACFSFGCVQKSSPVNTVATNSNQALSQTNSDDLYQHWIHSSEEEKTDSEQIFRPKDFKEFPPSRFRMQYIFRKNGECEWYFLSPDDNHRFKTGTWRIDPNDKNILQITKDGTTETYRIKELTKNVLRIALMEPKS
jgi:hypothetical protein